MIDPTAIEREHEDAWYSRAIAERFFEREGFRQLIAWNLDRLRRVVPLSATSRVLSLGCGTGEYEIALAPSVASILAIDLSPVAIDHARAQASVRRLQNVEFRVGSLVELEFPGGTTFDVVYALGVLHHLPTDARRSLLRRTFGWIRPGGVFYARDPNARGLLRIAAGLFTRGASFHSPNEEALDPVVVSAELEAAGFHDVAIGFTDVFGGPLPWLVAARVPLLWSTAFAIDRAWLATPGLRRLASQFDIRGRR